MLTGLDSAMLKLAWAANHIECLKLRIAVYSATNPCEIITDANREKTLNILSAPPPDISILAGEAVYQIRSALDHLVFGLVQKNSNTLPASWEKYCEFPLKLALPGGVTAPPADRKSFDKQIPQVSSSAFKFIERVQPYNPSRDGQIFRLLTLLSNFDKHRYLNLTVTRGEVTEYFKGERLGHARTRPLDHGAKIDNIADEFLGLDDAVDVQHRVSGFVTFDEPELGQAALKLPIEQLLDTLHDAVTGHIIPAFEKFIKQP